jgi:hypothetical protein
LTADITGAGSSNAKREIKNAKAKTESLARSSSLLHLYFYFGLVPRAALSLHQVRSWRKGA